MAFHSEILRIEPLGREINFDVTSSYKIKQVHVCSNCRKVKIGDRWLEVMDAFGTGELTANKSRFLAIYRICSACLADMHERSSQLLATASGRLDRLKETIERYHETYAGGGSVRPSLAEQGLGPEDPASAPLARPSCPDR